MRKIHFIFLIILAACVKPTPAPPDLLEKEKMAEILVNIHVSEASIEQEQIVLDSSKILYSAAHKDILAEFNVSEEQFKTSFLYYLGEVKQMDEIYTIVLDKLSVMEAQNKSK
jgi:hypothetical protein